MINNKLILAVQQNQIDCLCAHAHLQYQGPSSSWGAVSLYIFFSSLLDSHATCFIRCWLGILPSKLWKMLGSLHLNPRPGCMMAQFWVYKEDEQMLLTIAVLVPFTLVSDFEIGGLGTAHTLGTFYSCVYSSIIFC